MHPPPNIQKPYLRVDFFLYVCRIFELLPLTEHFAVLAPQNPAINNFLWITKLAIPGFLRL